MSTSGTSIPAGWYPDPAGGGGSRWWDGTGWTEHTLAAAPAAPAAPVAQTESAAPAAVTAPVAPAVQPYDTTAAGGGVAAAAPGASTSTVWIWIIVLLPILTFIPLPFIDWSGVFESALAPSTDPSEALAQQFAVYLQPAYLATTVLGWVSIGLTIWFAALDHRALVRRGVPQPFPWPWAFTAFAVGAIVYVIGRSVVVRRRTGGGLAPLWVYIGVLVVGLVLAGITVAQLLDQMLTIMESTVMYP